MIELSTSINLNEWAVDYTEFAHWIVENGIDAYAINTHGGNGSKLYYFRDLEDFTAFTLKFSKRSPNTDSGFYYCPYIPVHVI